MLLGNQPGDGRGAVFRAVGDTRPETLPEAVHKDSGVPDVPAYSVRRGRGGVSETRK